MKYRIEKNQLGEKNIPLEVYYGSLTDRFKEAFQITKHGLSRQTIKALALVKKVAAKTNEKLGNIPEKEAEAICLACDEILNGRLHGQFVVDSLHDGYGYGMEVNVCEVVANRANEMLGYKKGTYSPVTIDKVRLNQNINESNILVGKITSVKLVKKLVAECKKTYNILNNLIEKNINNEDFVKNFGAFSEILERDAKRIDKAIPSMLLISFGDKLDLSIESKKQFKDVFISCLNNEVTEKYVQAENSLIVNCNLDSFMYISTLVKDLMINFSRSISNLFIYLKENNYSFGEKISEYIDNDKMLNGFVKEVSYYIVGNDMTISRAVEEGKLEDNPYLVIIYASLYESVNLVRRTIRTIKELVLEKIK